MSVTSLNYKNLKSDEIMDRLGILNIYKLKWTKEKKKK